MENGVISNENTISKLFDASFRVGVVNKLDPTEAYQNFKPVINFVDFKVAIAIRRMCRFENPPAVKINVPLLEALLRERYAKKLIERGRAK